MEVRFASFNIQYGVGQDGQYDLERTTKELADLDIICLQEVTTNYRVCNFENQPDKLAKALNLYSVYAPAYESTADEVGVDGIIAHGLRGFGNMILSRWPIIYSRPHSLPRPQTKIPAEFHPSVDFPRVALEAVIDINGQSVRVISVHLSHLPGAQQEAQIDVLKRLVANLPNEAPLWENNPRISAWSENKSAPTVPTSTMIFGDFNFEPDSNEYQQMTAPLLDATTSLIDGWYASNSKSSSDLTCVENDGRFSRLDYLFATPDMSGKIVSAKVDQSIKVSDHFPIFFTVDIQDPNRT